MVGGWGHLRIDIGGNVHERGKDIIILRWVLSRVMHLLTSAIALEDASLETYARDMGLKSGQIASV